MRAAISWRVLPVKNVVAGRQSRRWPKSSWSASYRKWQGTKFRYANPIMAGGGHGLRGLEAVYRRERTGQPDAGRASLRHEPASDQPPDRRAGAAMRRAVVRAHRSR